MTGQQIMVKTYKAKKQQQAAEAMRRDAQKLAAQGWEIASQSWEPGRGGCLRTVLLGFVFAFVFPPAGSLSVTYRMAPPTPAPPTPQAQ